MIYIASPYSGQNMEARYVAVEEYTAEELKRGAIAYSPIVHCHNMAKRFNLPRSFDFWQHYNRGMIDKANELHVLMLDGWESSLGVAAEIAYARSLKIPVHFIPHIGGSGE